MSRRRKASRMHQHGSLSSRACVFVRGARQRVARNKLRWVGSQEGEFRQDVPEEHGAGMRRVVVSGLGIVAPNGIGREAFWSACVNGRSGVGPIRSFDASGHPVQIGVQR